MTYIQSLHPEGRIDMIRNQADKLGKLLEVDHEAQRLIYIDSNSRNEASKLKETHPTLETGLRYKMAFKNITGKEWK
jgi:hypothetical protein